MNMLVKPRISWIALTIFKLSILLTAAQADERPNILFIMSDDHTSQAIGAYANLLKSIDPTPTIDRLAREGICFDNAFCTNGICTPSRACIITGQYNHNNGVFDLGGRIEKEDQALPILMREAGYQTAMIGKWHLKAEPNFDYYKVLPGQGDYFNPTFRIQGEKAWPNNKVQDDGKHSSDSITDATLEWLNNRNGNDRPFFLCHQYKAPHDFFENHPRYDKYLSDTVIPEPDSLWTKPDTWGSLATRGFKDELVPHIGTSIGRRNPRRSYAIDLPKYFPKEFTWDYSDPNLSDADVKRLAYQAYLKKYLRCVKGIDDNLKRLFDYLIAEDLFDNTLIIYTGDQGFWLGEKDYQDKRWAYDPSQRMPLIVRYPKKIPAGVRSDALIENIDFPALILDYAGVQPPSGMQGKSFRSICESNIEPRGWKQQIYYRYWMHMAHHDNPGEMAIRTKTHKLIYFYGCDYNGENQTPPAWELYDLVEDPNELHNLYGHPSYRDLQTELKDKLQKLRLQIGDDGSHYPACERVIQEFWDYNQEDEQKAIQLSAEFKKYRESLLVDQ